jgi:alkylhydroperoxidase family enzyme
MQSRKHDSITDEDVACLIGDDRGDLDPQERMAIRFLDLLSADHHAIDADFYRELGEVFTTAQVVELGVACSEMMGLHRFIHTLDVFGSGEPALPYDRSQVDTAINADQAGAPA